MQGPDVFRVLKRIGAKHLYHANSVTTSRTFLQQVVVYYLGDLSRITGSTTQHNSLIRAIRQMAFGTASFSIMLTSTTELAKKIYTDPFCFSSTSISSSH